jgi:hypothetical protein
MCIKVEHTIYFLQDTQVDQKFSYDNQPEYMPTFRSTWSSCVFQA